MNEVLLGFSVIVDAPDNDSCVSDIKPQSEDPPTDSSLYYRVVSK